MVTGLFIDTIYVMNWLFPYWKARAYLTACIAIAWKRDVYIHGLYRPKELIQKYLYGETLMGWEGGDIWAFGHKDWDPEEMSFTPEAFIERIDPEQANFGIISGLKLWLELEKHGYMESDFEDARDKFEMKLAKYQAETK